MHLCIFIDCKWKPQTHKWEVFDFFGSCVTGIDSHLYLHRSDTDTCSLELWWPVNDTVTIPDNYSTDPKIRMSLLPEMSLLSLWFPAGNFQSFFAPWNTSAVISTKRIRGWRWSSGSGWFAPRFFRDASWLGQPTAAGGEISGMKSSPQTASNSILILHAAWRIDTWAEHVVKIRATAGDLDKQVTLTEYIRASLESDASLIHRKSFVSLCVPVLKLFRW